MAKRKNGPLSSIEGISFNDALATVSILGFLAIFVSSISPNIEIGAWIDGILFMIIGAVLAISGGITFVFRYFENGLTNDEITKLLTIIVGVTSFIVGIFTFPVQAFEGVRTVPVVGGIKTIISALAIIFIAVDTWVQKSLVK